MNNETTSNQIPYWWLAAEPPTLAEQPVAPDCDVAIVGAGYTGLAAALVLARAGLHVQVFDSQRPGEGASTRNGGVMSANIRISFSRALERLGVDRAVALYREGQSAREDLWRFVEEEGIDCDLNISGRFTGATHPKSYEAQGAEADLLNKYLDIGAYMVPRADQHEETGSELYHGGMVRPDIGHLHPAKLHAGILARATGSGAVVHGETPVLGYNRTGDTFNITTTRGPLRCKHLIMATNGYTDSANPWLRRRLVPVTSRIIVTEPLSPNLMQHLMPKGRTVGETRKLYRYYRPSPDGSRIVIGGRETIWSSDVSTNIEHIRKHLLEIYPELRDTRIEHSWNGFVAFNRDDIPRLFEDDGVIYACGYCGSGVVWARWLGEKAAHRVLRAPEAATALDGPPPAAVPLYWGKPWFVPLAIGWYGLQDRSANRNHRMS